VNRQHFQHQLEQRAGQLPAVSAHDGALLYLDLDEFRVR
jgi:GGDEF domain-containing protein